MKNLFAVAVGIIFVLATGASWAQTGDMMNGGMWGGNWMGGYGGFWVPLLVAVLVVGLVAWIVKRKD